MIPHERSLVKRLEGKPFALIGVNTDDNREKVQSKSKEMEVTWRSFWVGSSSSPVCEQWRIDGFPTIFVIDQTGIVRGATHSGEEMENLVDQLLKELEEKNAARPQ
jgi:hypothetical protein